ncbi:MAG TPA: UvrD-helicase domain-containing protein [Solirubrobacteraceae bacterium]
MNEFTPAQRAAIADRTGSYLLAASAGSGKTAVMVERFAAAVREDGVAVGAILAVTFTEKAAGELRERLRRRLTELGEHEHARAVDGAWIGTIHGFCARLLRSQPVAAGLDPRFEVLDEPAATRLAGRAYERALEAWAAAEGEAALDLAAAYGPGLRDLIVGASASLRARGQARPRLRLPAAAPPAPDPAELAAAREAALRALAGAGEGARVAAAREALAAAPAPGFGGDAAGGVTVAAGDGAGGEAAGVTAAAAGNAGDAAGGVTAATGRDGAGGDAAGGVTAVAGGGAAGAVPWPGELASCELKGGAKALEAPECEAYRAAWAAYRTACAEHHAHAALQRLDRLLDRFGAEYDEAKSERSAVDFQDLELRARDLLADPAIRRRWAERFALIMVDEFQDTNPLQLELLGALERDNLFAVGDEFQSIYRFRHADVGIFRARADHRTRALAESFRAPAELLDVLNATFAPLLGPRFAPLRSAAPAPDPDAPLRLFDPDPGPAPVELLVTDTAGWEDLADRVGLAAGGDQPWRRAEARLVAHRLREEIDGGRRPGEIVVLVRATASLRLLEEALDEQGLPTYVVGGRGYWSQEQVRDGLAWLAVLANPRDEEALLTVLASPFCGASSDALILLAQQPGGMWAALQATAGRTGAEPTNGSPPAGTAGGSGAGAVGGSTGAEPTNRSPAAGTADGPPGAGTADGWTAALPPEEAERLGAVGRLLAAERESAERLALEVLLERAIAATGYDLAVLALPGGDRRLANLRKLMRLARAYEQAEGRDLRGFLADAAAQDLAQAREGEAALESEGLDAVRLMTIHRAKGLEFPVVCVADLGRGAATARPRLLVGPDGAPGLRLAAPGGGDPVATPAWDRLADADASAEAEEERRLLYVAMTRAQERLIVSGGAGKGPMAWLAPALLGGPPPAAPDAVVERPGRVRVRLNSPQTLGTVLPEAALSPRPPVPAAPTTALPAAPIAVPAAPPRARPAPQRISYSSLSDYARCGYRYYLTRDLRLPRDPAPPPAEPVAESPGGDPLASSTTPREGAATPTELAAAAEEPALDALTRGSIVHSALETLDFARPAPPAADAVHALGEAEGVELTDADVEDVQALVAAFAVSPLCARLAAAPHVRREAAFAFALEPDGAGPLVNGFVDVIAREPDGAALVLDYKSDRLEGADPEELVERDYATQRLVYALAALRDGAPRVEVAHCLLERPAEPVTRTYTAADAPELTARLSAFARGLLAHEFPVAAVPHRELCGDCPGRRALCSWGEDATLRPPPPAASVRPPPDPSPAAPDRRSSPAGAASAAGPPPR